MQISPYIFKINDRTYRVKEKKKNQNKYKPEYAYIFKKGEYNSVYSKYIYIYRGEIEHYEDAYYPGVYMLNGNPLFIRPKTDMDKNIYSISRLIKLTPESIFVNLDDVGEPTEPIITDGDVFKPQIKDSDDIALAGMKYVIGEKNINFNNYSGRFPDVATKNNSRRALTHGNTLKMDMAARYCDVFDINMGIIFWDKPNCLNPISPDQKTVYIIFNDDYIDLKDDDVKIKLIEKN